MKLIIHSDMRNSQVIEATRIVVEDKEGNPIMVALEYAPEMIVASHAGDNDFNTLLANLGINKVVVCTDVQEKPLDQVVFEG